MIYVCIENGLWIELGGGVSYGDMSNPSKHGQWTLNGDDDGDFSVSYVNYQDKI